MPGSRQWTPIKKDSDGIEQTIALATGGTAYSSPVYNPSKNPFAWLGVHVVATGNATVKISIEYKYPGEDKYAAAIVVESGLNVNATTTAKFYRLDAVLHVNWVPNVQHRYKFEETGGAGGSAVIKGVNSV